jgi:hypothetical protein
MADQQKAGGRTGTWPWPQPGAAGVAAPWLGPLPGHAGLIGSRLRQWAAAELAPGQLMPWLPVAFHGVPSNYKKPLFCGHNLSY